MIAALPGPQRTRSGFRGNPVDQARISSNRKSAVTAGLHVGGAEKSRESKRSAADSIDTSSSRIPARTAAALAYLALILVRDGGVLIEAGDCRTSGRTSQGAEYHGGIKATRKTEQHRVVARDPGVDTFLGHCTKFGYRGLVAFDPPFATDRARVPERGLRYQ